METAAIGTTTASTTPTDRGMESLRSEDFFRILVEELKTQDPFEPTKTADMIGQISDIRSIELSRDLTDVLSAMTQEQHTAGSSELLGKFVTAQIQAEDGTNYVVGGVVTGIRFESGGRAVLELDTGESVPAEYVVHVMTPETAEQLAATPPGTPTQSTEATDKSAAAKSKQPDRPVWKQFLADLLGL